MEKPKEAVEDMLDFAKKYIKDPDKDDPHVFNAVHVQSIVLYANA